MIGRPKLVAGGTVIAVALVYLIWVALTQTTVYFLTPAELQASAVPGQSYRIGGLVARGSLVWRPETLELAFALTDGQATVPVRHRGTPPDLFGEGRGAVVEGRWIQAGPGPAHMAATQILAKHSEEYAAPAAGADTGAARALLERLRAKGTPK